MVVSVFDVPERTVVQRREALKRANAIRVYRAQVKLELKAGRRSVVDELLEVDARMASMKVYDLLLAVPKHGRVKVNALLRKHGISPSKTLAGLSPRQRQALVLALSAGRAMVRS